MDRRSFIGFGTLAASALMGGKFSSAFAEDTRAKPGETVETNLGKVRGTAQNGVHAFKGVPYAASTAGENRFMPPKKREPWTGRPRCVRTWPEITSAFVRLSWTGPAGSRINGSQRTHGRGLPGP